MRIRKDITSKKKFFFLSFHAKQGNNVIKTNDSCEEKGQ